MTTAHLRDVGLYFETDEEEGLPISLIGLTITPIGEEHICSFWYTLEHHRSPILEVLEDVGLAWTEGEHGPEFRFNQTDTLDVIKWATQFTGRLRPTHLEFWFARSGYDDPEDREVVSIEIPALDNPAALRIRSEHFAGLQNATESRTTLVCERLRATGLCTRVIWRTGDNPYADVILTDSATADRLRSYEQLAAAYPASIELF